MRLNKFLLAGVTAMSLASTAMAGGRNPGSLLLFPEFDNRVANLTLLTVTNTNADTVNGTIKVEFVYIGKYAANNVVLDCLEFNRTHTLTPNDTLTVITSAHNPGQEQGYVYVFAKHPTTGKAIAWDYLIGSMIVQSGIESFGFESLPHRLPDLFSVRRDVDTLILNRFVLEILRYARLDQHMKIIRPNGAKGQMLCASRRSLID